jgi:hypothetical protein
MGSHEYIVFLSDSRAECCDDIIVVGKVYNEVQTLALPLMVLCQTSEVFILRNISGGN